MKIFQMPMRRDELVFPISETPLRRDELVF
jgi:hypothetical protein